MNLILLLLLLTLAVQFYLRSKQKKATSTLPYYSFKSPDWVKNAVIYQLNIRQFTHEGTLNAAAQHLPRLKNLGVDVIWMMPFFPICEREKKLDANETEGWGSPYAPYDFESIHEKIGTLDDFRAFMAQTHDLGLKLVLDFVPNHTGWDSKWMLENPDWYIHTPDGNIMPVTSDQGEVWSDIAQLDFNNLDMREAWMKAHEFWVKNFNIDGYREDCAWGIPLDYWLELRQRLDAIKPVYMLAEDEVHGKEQFDVCFETNYGWGTHHFMKQIAQKDAPAYVLHQHTEGIKERHGTRGWQMNFTQNHDENTWHGSEYDLFGAGADCFTALTFVIEGTGLVYNGQEVSLNKRLSFFGKDEIDWTGKPRTDFFKTLIDLKHRNKAVWNGRNGGFIQKIQTDHDDIVYAFVREKDGDKIVCIFNLKNTAVNVSLSGAAFTGVYTDVFSGQQYPLSIGTNVTLQPYQFHILTK